MSASSSSQSQSGSPLNSPLVRRLLAQLAQTREATPDDGRRGEILSAAEALLREKGLDGFSMRRLADRVGIKLASLQYHFRNKGLLMEALVERSAEIYHQELMDLLRDLGDQPKALFEAVIDWMCAANAEGGNLDFQLWALAAHDPIANAALDRYMASYRELLFELMAAINPKQKAATRWRRAALISTMIEGSLLIIGEGRLPHKELSGLTKETRHAALMLAISD
jgi:AcrR family transcriptional regulator